MQVRIKEVLYVQAIFVNEVLQRLFFLLIVATGIYHGSFKSVVPQNITVYWEHIKLKPFYFHDRYMLVIISVIKASRKPLSSFQRILLRNSLSDHTSWSYS